MTAFYILAPIMVLAALGILFVRKAVHAALLLAVVMISDDHQDYYRGKSLPIFPIDSAINAEVNPEGAPRDPGRGAV